MSPSQSIFPNILAIPRPPFPPPLGSKVVLCPKATLILRHFVGNNFDLGGGGVWFRKSVVVEIVLLRSILRMKGYKFSSSFVRDCNTVYETFWSFQTKLLGSIKSFKVLLEMGRLWLMDEINPYRARSLSEASRASFAALNILSRIMEKGFL